MLTTSAVVLAKLQTGAGVQATCDPATDALLVDAPEYNVDPTVLERKFARADLSPLPHLIGRKLAMVTFSAELRGNGKQNSGNLADAARILRLIQGCGYAASAMTGTGALNISDVYPDTGNPASTPAITWAKGGTLTNGPTKPLLFTLTITGANNAYSLATNDGNAPTVGTLTSGTVLALAGGLTLTPTFTGTLPVGAAYRVLQLPVGLKAKPVTDNQQVLTLEVYFSGLKHVLVDAMGTFKITANAGQYATIEFTFTGKYVPTVDAPLPNAVYETTLPAQVELANLTWGSKADLTVNSFTMDQGNSVVTRSDVNSKDGYKGVRISGRDPVGGLDPEATTEAENPFWADFLASAAKHFVANVGSQPGNVVTLHGPAVQTTAQKYGDRDNIRTYDVTTAFKRSFGDDESFLYFL